MIRRACVLLVLLFAQSFGSGLLYVDKTSYVSASGGSYDLLDPLTPLSRRYSGSYAVKDKSEFHFNHTLLPNEVALENIIVGLKNEFVKGLKFGAYLTYLNPGSINHLDSRGALVEQLDASEILIGIPVIFNVHSLGILSPGGNTKRTPKEKKAENETSSDEPVIRTGNPFLSKLLYSLNLACNLNYFQSTLGPADSGAARTFFADANVSSNFKVPYIGKPENIIDESVIRSEQAVKISEVERKFSQQEAAILSAKNQSDENKIILTNQTAIKKYIAVSNLNLRYDKKAGDIRRVASHREEMYMIYNSLAIEMTSGDISNIVKNAVSETEGLIRIASNAIHENVQQLYSGLMKEFEQNQLIIDEYTVKFSNTVTNTAVYDMCVSLFNLYKVHVVEKYKGAIIEISEKMLDDEERALDPKSKAKSTIPARRDAMKKMKEAFIEETREYTEYTATTNDTWESISQFAYSNSQDAKIIAAYNKMKIKKQPDSGQVFRIPVKGVSEKKRQRDLLFAAETRNLEKNISRIRFSPVEKLYYDLVMTKIRRRIEILEYKKEIENETTDSYLSLNNVRAGQIRALNAKSQSLIRDLYKDKLKKEFDILSGGEGKKTAEAQADYKKKERALFLDLLNTIFKSRKKLITEFKAAEVKKNMYRVTQVRKLYDDKYAALQENFTLRRNEAGTNKILAAESSSAFENERAALFHSRDTEINAQRAVLNEKIADYDWELYTTHLIYLGSDQQPYNLAFGFSAMNLGIPSEYKSEGETFNGTKENLPITLSADANYEFLKHEIHSSRLYVHYEHNELQGHVFGSGLMYRLADLIELRLGGSRENGTILPAASAAFLVNFGLMKYRIDAGIVYDMFFGPVFNFGISVVL